jgi:hypothetical protein
LIANFLLFWYDGLKPSNNIVTKEGRKMRQLFHTYFIGVVIVVAFASASFADDKQFEGEIVGVHANARLEDLTTGNVKNIAYGGKLEVLLQDGQEVDATCPEELLSELKGAPKFNTKEIHGGVVAGITLNMKEKQKVLLIREKSNEWRVVKILK